MARTITGFEEVEEPAQIRVLDLFSGSGFSALKITQRCPGAQVFCVDAWIPQSVSLVASSRRVVWLTTGVEEILGVGDKAGVLEGRWDLVTLDPPHAALVGMIHQLLDTIAKRTPWLVIYQGHSSQSGRTKALRPVLLERFAQVGLMRVDSEEIIVAGPDEQGPRKHSFEHVLNVVAKSLKDENWEVGWQQWKRPE